MERTKTAFTSTFHSIFYELLYISSLFLKQLHTFLWYFFIFLAPEMILHLEWMFIFEAVYKHEYTCINIRGTTDLRRSSALR